MKAHTWEAWPLDSVAEAFAVLTELRVKGNQYARHDSNVQPLLGRPFNAEVVRSASCMCALSMADIVAIHQKNNHLCDIGRMIADALEGLCDED